MAREHPDSCCEDRKDLCKEMAQKINRTCKIIPSSCDSYEPSAKRS
ncbi:MAG TPA: hypothetical protein PLZ42_05840 [Methanothrix sp.]|nr:hypothetical protein [Methanothrix sp.]